MCVCVCVCVCVFEDFEGNYHIFFGVLEQNKT